MSAIEAAAMRVRTMADGSLRIEVEVSPTDAQAAFSLFGKPGAPMALAALKIGYAQADAPKATEQDQSIDLIAPKKKIGPLAYWLVCRCSEPEFWKWLKSMGYKCESAKTCELFQKSILNVKSRNECDTDIDARNRCHRLICGPYSKWLAAKGVI